MWGLVDVSTSRTLVLRSYESYSCKGFMYVKGVFVDRGQKRVPVCVCYN